MALSDPIENVAVPPREVRGLMHPTDNKMLKVQVGSGVILNEVKNLVYPANSHEVANTA